MDKPSNKKIAAQIHRVVLQEIAYAIPYQDCPLKRLKAAHDKEETIMYLRGLLGGNEGITIDPRNWSLR